MIIHRWLVKQPKGKRKGCLFGIPGRDVPAEMMERFCMCADLEDTLIVVPEPFDLAWYPMPNGANDQAASIQGMKEAVIEVNDLIIKLQKFFRIRRSKIALVGYSAGGVLALELAGLSEKPFAAVVSMAGAILDTESFPEAKNDTPILIRHSVDDEVFKWDERYIPMKDTLIKKKYNLYTSVKYDSGHTIGIEDARLFGEFMSPHLGYKKIYTVDE